MGLQITLKWLRELNVKCRTIKNSEENTGKKIHNFRVGKDVFRQDKKKKNFNHKKENLIA